MAGSKIISHNIIGLRTYLSLTQEELAERLHLTRQMIADWENERSLPGGEASEILMKFMNIEISDLFNVKLKFPVLLKSELQILREENKMLKQQLAAEKKMNKIRGSKKQYASG